MPSPSLDSALVRILVNNKSPRNPVGAGFLAAPRHVVTCAHVIADVLTIPRNSSQLPEHHVVFVDFPLIDNQPKFAAKVVNWFPVMQSSIIGEIEDIAVLELLQDIPLQYDAQPAPVVVMDDFADRSVRMCGFPKGFDIGDWIDGKLMGLVASGKAQFDGELGNRFVKPGFSGTPGRDKRENAVCGIVVSMIVRDNVPSAYMIPASTLIKAFPELDKLSRPTNPYKGLEAFREKDADFYFGRDKTIEDLSQKVHDQPFVLVIGASGSGKSSVVLAGVTPALRKTGASWLIADCRPKKTSLFTNCHPALSPFFMLTKWSVLKK